MTQKQHLQAILEKTAHIKGGLAAEDMDVVDNAIAEREEMIAAYARAGFVVTPEECARIAAAISKMNDENNNALKALMDNCNEKIFEARRKLKELQTGKKATAQYYGGAMRGGAYDSRR